MKIPDSRRLFYGAKIILALVLVACVSRSWSPSILAETGNTQGNTLRVNNLELFTCNNVTIDVNKEYRGILPQLKAGESRDIALTEFKDKTGNIFPANERVKSVIIHAERPDGTSGEVSFQLK
jgi:hypothetical protein